MFLIRITHTTPSYVLNSDYTYDSIFQNFEKHSIYALLNFSFQYKICSIYTFHMTISVYLHFDLQIVYLMIVSLRKRTK